MASLSADLILSYLAAGDLSVGGQEAVADQHC